MSAAEVIAHYESLAALTGQMLEAAQRGEWDALIDLEEKRSQLVTALKPADANTRLVASARERKRALIESVLAQDTRIRTLVQAWMSECELSMQSNAQELRLLRKYGA